MNPSGNLSVVDEVLLNATGHVCSSGNMTEHELIYHRFLHYKNSPFFQMECPIVSPQKTNWLILEKMAGYSTEIGHNVVEVHSLLWLILLSICVHK